MPRTSSIQTPPGTPVRRSPRFAPTGPRRSPRLATGHPTAVANPKSTRRPAAPTVVATRTRAPAHTPVAPAAPSQNRLPAPRRPRPFPMAAPTVESSVTRPSQQTVVATPTRTSAAAPRRPRPFPVANPALELGPIQPSQQAVVAAPTRPTRTYADRGRSYLSESLSSISSIVSTPTSPDRLPTVLEIIQELRGVRVRPIPTGGPVAPESVSAARSPLAKMVHIVKGAGTCGICKDYMRTPYITSCGHACCPGCLRGWFESKLRATLRPYLAVNHYTLHHSSSACQIIPKSFVQLDQLKNVLQEHGCPLRPVFRYPCPICRTPCAKAPTRDFALQMVLTEARAALGSLLDVSIAEDVHALPSPPFAGLFML